MAFGLGTFGSGSGGLGEMLSSQVGEESDELRKKRRRDQQGLMGSMGSLGGVDNSSVFGGRFDQFAQLVTGMGRGMGDLFKRRLGGGGFMQ